MNNHYYRTTAKALLTGCGFLCATFTGWAQDDEEEVFELSPFTIDASQDEGYYASQTMAGGRLNQSLKNTGAAIQVITKDFMDDLGATGIDELLQYTTSSEVAGILGNFTGGSTDGDGELSTGGARRDPDGTSRIRGLAAPDRTRNFFITEIPFDSYNTERIDINRGANSFLFGLGTPAGLINNGLAQARFNDSNEISTRVGSGGKDPSYRASFGVNRVIMEDKLAIRVNGLMDRTQYRQRPTYKNDDRIYTAFSYRPFGNQNTVISGYMERGEQIGNAPDVLLPQHNLDTFLNEPIVGRMSLDAYDLVRYFNNPEGPNNTNQRRTGVRRGSTTIFDSRVAGDYDTPIFRDRPNVNSINNWNWSAGAYGYVFDGANGNNSFSFPLVAQFRGADYNRGDPFWDPDNRGKGAPQMRVHGNRSDIGGFGANEELAGSVDGDFYESDAGWQDQGFTDLNTFDFSRNNLGWDNDFYSRDFFNYNVSLKQTFWEGKGGFEIAFDSQDLYKDSYTAFNGGNSKIIFDINEKLLLPTQEYLDTGENPGVIDNPNFGRPFAITKSGQRTEDLQDETLRFTGFAKYDFADHMNNDSMSKILGNHTLTILADQSQSDEIWINWTTNSFGLNGFDPGVHIGPANARQSANAARSTPVLVYLGPQQLDAFSDPSFGLEDFQLTPATYDLRLEPGLPIERTVWYLGDGVNNTNYDSRIAGDATNPINGDEEWRTVTTTTYDVPTKNYRLQRTNIESLAVNSQSMMLDNHLVLNMGYREDTIDNDLNTEAPLLGIDEVADLRAHDTWLLEDGLFTKTKSSVFGYGGVVYWPKKLIGLPEWIDDITLHYNTSENFVPATDRVDQFRNKVGSPTGESKDWGISMYLMNNKVVARFNWYDAFLENERSPVSNLFNQTNSALFAHASQLNMDLTRVDNDRDGFMDVGFAESEYGYDPELGYAPAEIDPETMEVLEPARNLEELTAEFYPFINESIAAFESIIPALTPELKEAYNFREASDGSFDTQWAGQITDTNDIAAKGFEAEIILNPTNSWRIAFNAAQQETVLTNIAPRLTSLFEDIWFPHLELYGTLDWNNPLEPVAGNNTLQQRNSQMIDYFVAKAQEGQPTGEQREWRFNFITNYTFREGLLKNFQFGGAARWQDEYSSGYPLIEDGGFIKPDIKNAYKTEAYTSIDLTFGYRKKILDNVDWRMQINVRNIQNWDNKDLEVSRYQPDGSAARVRYSPPRQIFLTNTFRF